MNEARQYTFVLQAHNEVGLLSRITQIFARRGCGVTAISVNSQPGEPWELVTIQAHAVRDPKHLAAQLEKLIDVQRVTVITR